MTFYEEGRLKLDDAAATLIPALKDRPVLDRINADGTFETLVGTGELGDGGDGVAKQIQLNHPTNLAFDRDGQSARWAAVAVWQFLMGLAERQHRGGDGNG